jgi:Luciferase-like monooxygenase
MGAIAVRTSRIRFGTMITPISRRRPWKLARECVTVDQLSRGRLILAVGMGVSRCFCRVPFSTLVEAAESRFGAFVGNRQKALHAFIADYIRMSITGFSLRQCGQLLLGSVGIGMVGQDDVGTRL